MKDTAAAIRNDFPVVPENVSAFNNDAGYLTSDSAVITTLQGDVTTLQEATRKDALCDSVETCVKGWISDSTRMVVDSLGAYYDTTHMKSAIHDTADVLRSMMTDAANDAKITIQKNGVDVGDFTVNQATDQTINISVPTCDDLANCLLIQDILARLDRLEYLNDSLANELDKMKPALTVTGPEETTVCLGSSKPVTYTATFHNCSSSDYTLAWKVNGADSSNVTGSKLIVNVETAGDYEVVCIATRSDNTSVTDTVTTTVTVDNAIPSFTATVNNLTVTLSDVVNTATIQWNTDSEPVAFSGTTAEHTYAVADTITITATSEGGCTYVYGLRLQATAPAVTTVSIPDETITVTTAIANGTVTFDGGIPSTKRGMVFSSSNEHPELGAEGEDSVMNGTGMGDFACNLKRLVPCTQYYVCAFAFNDVDTVYGEVKTFTTPSFTCGSTLTDIDGNEYATLLLGSQCWMKQNLRTTHYADGTEIPKGGLNSSSYSQPFYYEPDSNIATYGRLYNWTAAMHGSSSTSANPSKVQGVCPDGWHMPSDAEWTQLTSFVASKSENVCDNNPAYIAKALASNEGWGNWGTSTIACLMVTDPAITNNKTQFSVLPAGTWEVGQSAGYKNHGHSIFRTATEYEQVEYQAAYAREFYSEHAYVDRTAPIKEVGYSVRCVLDCAGQTYKPTVSVVRITNTGGTLSMAASVVSDGGENVTERGVCWGTASQPTISSDHTADSGTGIGDFTVTATLTPGTTYYVRAYATNSAGTAYGNQESFTVPLIDEKSCPDAPTVTDHEGNVYATVLIGTQCWMRENLRTTTSPKTGTYLVNTENKTGVERSSYMGSKVAHWYMNDPTTYAPKGYGLLYNWCAAMDTANPTNYVEVPTSSTSGNNTAFSFPVTSNHRGICPVGWHIPFFADLNALKNNYTNSDLLAGGDVWLGSPSNASGFTALPASYFGNGYQSFQSEDRTYFWSCTNGVEKAQSLYLTYSQKKTGLMEKNYGMSVRCVRD